VKGSAEVEPKLLGASEKSFEPRRPSSGSARKDGLPERRRARRIRKGECSPPKENGEAKRKWGARRRKNEG